MTIDVPTSTSRPSRAGTDSRSPASRRTVISAAIALAVFIGLIALQNVLIAAFFPRLGRVTHDFSSTYLARSVSQLAKLPPQVLFFGDSFVWGYGLPDDSVAVARLTRDGCACANLSFNLENPTNMYALVRLLQHDDVRPKSVVIELDQVFFNARAMEYRALRDQVYDATKPVLDARDLTLFHPPHGGLRRKIDRALSSVSLLYALRSDAREAFVGEPDEPLTYVSFDQLYDLAPLDESNVGVHYLERTLDLLRAKGTPVAVYLAPTNARAFGPRATDPRYLANAAFVARVAARHGARVLSLAPAFGSTDFIDNVHLNAAGQKKLAALLERRLPDLEPAVQRAPG